MIILGLLVANDGRPAWTKKVLPGAASSVRMYRTGGIMPLEPQEPVPSPPHYPFINPLILKSNRNENFEDCHRRLVSVLEVYVTSPGRGRPLLLF